MIRWMLDYGRWLFADFLHPTALDWLHTHGRQVLHLVAWFIGLSLVRNVVRARLARFLSLHLTAKEVAQRHPAVARHLEQAGFPTHRDAIRLYVRFPELWDFLRRNAGSTH